MKPTRLFQILITDGPVDAADIGEGFQRNVESLKATYPGAEYTRLGDAEIQDFLADNHPPAVLEAYRGMTPYAFKADLARYCLLFTHGGLYSDLSYMHLRAIDVDGKCEMVVFRDIPGHPSWAVSNAIILAEAGNPVLARAIERAVANFHRRFYGHSPLDLTGPYMFGRVLAETEDWTGIRFGDSQLLNVDKTGRANIVKVMPAGEVVAIRNKTRNGGITDLVAKGGNDYIELWNERCVWGEAPIARKKPSKLKQKLGKYFRG